MDYIDDRIYAASGDISWTPDIPGYIYQSLMSSDPWNFIVTSHPFVTQMNGQNVTFMLRFAVLPDTWLRDVYIEHDSPSLKTIYGCHSQTGDRVAICVKSSNPIELVPKLKLIANHGSWYNMPVNWYGRNGTTKDKQFFGSTKLIDITTLVGNYMVNGEVMIRCTLVVETLKELAGIEVSKNISDVNVVDAFIIAKAINSVPIKDACLNHLAGKTEADLLTLPCIDKLHSDLLAEVLARLN